MTSEEAIQIADRLVSQSKSKSAIKLRLLSARHWPEKKRWSVLYEPYDPSDPSTIIDGPVVVHVDEQSGEAKFL